MERIAAAHHPAVQVDITRAYHFGSRYNVEMEIVLPAAMTVAESHDIALGLQHKVRGIPRWRAGMQAQTQACVIWRKARHRPLNLLLLLARPPLLLHTRLPAPGTPTAGARSLLQLEALDQVERAFVHVDYQRRHLPEHKVRAPWYNRLWLRVPSHCSTSRAAARAQVGQRQRGHRRTRCCTLAAARPACTCSRLACPVACAVSSFLSSRQPRGLDKVSYTHVCEMFRKFLCADQ